MEVVDKLNQVDQHLEAMEVEASLAQEDGQNQVIIFSFYFVALLKFKIYEIT